ncbi:hypothetical protein [Rhodanobacter sp. C03]|uniref:hypothetical protein n=1 Tax=Rhodanobacter sp. C03 TaxID=1945858 RepID=UPI0009849AF4|nr:hypothetical protein [Rhodanobacter sp. C03]OOG59925.1 hypothetical protein B0E48_03870 [Rhodanobacter sp. C03]
MSASEGIVQQLTRIPFFLKLWSRFPLGPLRLRVEHGIFPYPHYAYGLFWAATLASRLGIERISAIEFGVAGGRGLIALERAATEISEATGVGIDVFGFDSGEGMPAPVDYRDLPHIWGAGFYRMDADKLRKQLSNAKLVLGDVRTTTAGWIAEQHAPVGFVAFDLDYYSATVAALQILSGPPSTHLPRVYSYFDDVTANDLGCMNPYVGELLAINEFNQRFADRKVCRIELLRVHRHRWERWQERMFAFHNFTHPQYTQLVIPTDRASSQLPLA